MDSLLLYMDLGFQVHKLAGDGVGEIQGFGAKPLTDSIRLRCAVLGVAHNGKAHVSAVDTQLVGAPCNRLQLQKCLPC